MVYSKAREGQSPTEIHEWSLMNFTEFVVNCAQTSWMNSRQKPEEIGLGNL